MRLNSRNFWDTRGFLRSGNIYGLLYNGNEINEYTRVILFRTSFLWLGNNVVTRECFENRERSIELLKSGNVVLVVLSIYAHRSIEYPWLESINRRCREEISRLGCVISIQAARLCCCIRCSTRRADPRRETRVAFITLVRERFFFTNLRCLFVIKNFRAFVNYSFIHVTFFTQIKCRLLTSYKQTCL